MFVFEFFPTKIKWMPKTFVDEQTHEGTNGRMNEHIKSWEKQKTTKNTRAKKIIITTNKQHSSKLAFAHNIQQMRLLLLWLLCTVATTAAFFLICLVLFLCTWSHFPQFIYFPSVIPRFFSLSLSHLFIQLISVSISNMLDALQFLFLKSLILFFSFYFSGFMFFACFFFIPFSLTIRFFFRCKLFSICLALHKTFGIVFHTSIFVFNTVWSVLQSKLCWHSN